MLCTACAVRTCAAAAKQLCTNDQTQAFKHAWTRYIHTRLHSEPDMRSVRVKLQCSARMRVLYKQQTLLKRQCKSDLCASIAREHACSPAIWHHSKHVSYYALHICHKVCIACLLKGRHTSSVVLLPLMLYWNTFSNACIHLSPSTPALPPAEIMMSLKQ